MQDLAELCPRVKELHLPYNHIAHGKDVAGILSALPSLKVFDLSHNPLDSSTFAAAGQLSTRHLSTLVLTGTAISWQALQVCLRELNQLQEVHLSINNYDVIALPETFQHPNVQRLHFNENQITEWAELAKLSHAFPNLHTLIACGNPIREIPELTSDLFPCLQMLNLNNSALSSWTSLEHLQALCKLEELSVMKVPLGKDMDQRKRRKAFVARLPKIVKLNKSVVTDKDREAAEHWLIRELAVMPDPPTIYQSLVEKHGLVNKLADVDLSPPKTVKVEFHFDGLDRPKEEGEVVLNQTVWEFKTWIAKNLLSMPTSSFRVFYMDPSIMAGTDVFRHNNKYVYSYRFTEGTEIHIEMK